MPGVFVPNRKDVAHEAFEGEVILIHFPSGRYFRLDEAGRVAWAAIETGATNEQIASALAAAFDVGEANAAASAERFLASLLEHGLVASAPSGEAGSPPAARPAAVRRPFVEPRVEVFSDLQELFLVDPIHDVDETGWPHAKP